MAFGKTKDFIVEPLIFVCMYVLSMPGDLTARHEPGTPEKDQSRHGAHPSRKCTRGVNMCRVMILVPR